MSATESVPELVEQLHDLLDQIQEQVVYVRNAGSEATYRLIEANDVIMKLHAATAGERVEDPDEPVHIVLPTGEAYRSQRRRRIELVMAVAVIVILTIAVWWVGR